MDGNKGKYQMCEGYQRGFIKICDEFSKLNEKGKSILSLKTQKHLTTHCTDEHKKVYMIACMMDFLFFFVIYYKRRECIYTIEYFSHHVIKNDKCSMKNIYKKYKTIFMMACILRQMNEYHFMEDERKME